MHNAVKISAAFAAFVILGGSALAQTPPPTPAPPAHQGLFSKLFHHPKSGTPSVYTQRGSGALGQNTPLSGGVIGNKKSHVYHLPGDKGTLPAPQNRVYFASAAAAQAAGYHAAGSGSHKTARPMMHGMKMHGAPMPGTPAH